MIIVLVLSLNASAQWTIVPESGISVIKKANFGESWNPGLRVGAGVGYELDPQWSVKSGLYYVNRGFKLGQDYAETIGVTELTRHFIQMPMMFNYSVPLNENMKLNLAAGPYIAYSLSDNKLGGNFAGTKDNLFNGMSKFDWGISALVGIEINNTWQFNLNYSNSLGEENKHDGVGFDYYTINLSIAYKFKL